MSNANADSVKLSYIKEVTPGTTPSAVRKPLRFVSESLNDTATAETSKEITGNRRVRNSRVTARAADGSINCELSCKSYDDLFAGLLMATGWSSGSGIGHISAIFDSETDTLTDSDANGNFVDVSVGDWLYIKDPDGSDDMLLKVLSVASNKNSVVVFPVVATDLLETSLFVPIKKCAAVVDGSTEHSFTVQKQYSDLTDVYHIYRGMRLSQGSISLPATGAITNTFDFMGKSQEDAAAAIGVAQAADFTTEPMLDTELVGVYVNGAAFELMTASLTINNNLRERPLAGSIYRDGFGYGKFLVTGSLTAYFANQAAAGYFKTETEFPMILVFKDVDGNYFIVDLPKVKISTRESSATGENSDVVLTLGIQSLEGETDAVTLRIVKLEASEIAAIKTDPDYVVTGTLNPDAAGNYYNEYPTAGTMYKLANGDWWLQKTLAGNSYITSTPGTKSADGWELDEGGLAGVYSPTGSATGTATVAAYVPA